jgi:nicotinamidase-related amidase
MMTTTYQSKPSPWINSGGYDRALEFDLTPAKTALITIDLQHLDAHPDYGLGADAKRRGVYDEYFAYYFNEVAAMLPRVVGLQQICHASHIQVIHVVIAALTETGRDVGLGHQRHNLLALPGSPEAQLLPELGPHPGEIILTKTASGVFSSTAIDRILRNMGIQTLIFVGVVTNYCVETAVRDACDFGYNVYLVSDCCAAMMPHHQHHALEVMDNVYCRVKTAAEMTTLIQKEP